MLGDGATGATLTAWGALSPSTSSRVPEGAQRVRRPARRTDLPRDTVDAAFGGAFAAALTRDGRVLAWAGDGAPRPVLEDRAVAAIAFTPDDELAFVTTRGELFLSSLTASGCPPVPVAGVPRRVARPSAGRVEALSCSGTHCAALARGGDALFRFAERGRQRQGSAHHAGEDDEASAVPGVPAGCRRVSCGNGFTVLLDGAGDVWTFGSDQYGVLGLTSTPWKAPDGALPTASSVDGGGSNDRDDGDYRDATASRRGRHRRRPLAAAPPVTRAPRRVEALRDLAPGKIVHVAAGGAHVLALSADGQVYSWGFGQWGQLAHHNYAHFSPVSRVTAFDGARGGYGALGVLDVAAGENHSMFLLGDGATLVSTGANESGQLGNGTLQPSCRLERVRGLAGKRREGRGPRAETPKSSVEFSSPSTAVLRLVARAGADISAALVLHEERDGAE